MEKINFITIIELGNEIKNKAVQMENLNKIKKSDFMEVFCIELNQTNLDEKTKQKLLSKINSSIDYM